MEEKEVKEEVNDVKEVKKKDENEKPTNVGVTILFLLIAILIAFLAVWVTR